ncbi:hypothetical protein RsTz2092_02110 [Deferribacterales bacterium RsTz2092]|nr:hypothetical protein AGMMS49941_10750 [Deferribacterales bacterium]
MKRFLGFLFVFVLLASVAVAQEKTYVMDKDAFNKDDIIVDSSGKPITGIVKGYYESGALQGEAAFKGGKMNGVLKEYYESGALGREETYKDDKLIGVTKEYSESGALLREGTFKEGKYIRKDYDEYGSLQVIITFKDDMETPISGKCYWGLGEGKGLTMNSAQLANWLKGLEVICK